MRGGQPSTTCAELLSAPPALSANAPSVGARLNTPLLVLWLVLLLCAGGLAGCSSGPPGTRPGVVADSMLGYDRTFDAAFAAMSDQKMVISVNDRRNGRIVGERDGETLTTTPQPMRDGTLRANFVPQGDSPAALALQQRVADSYTARMANQSLLGGFKGGGSDRGPVPCPSGPAFCP